MLFIAAYSGFLLLLDRVPSHTRSLDLLPPSLFLTGLAVSHHFVFFPPSVSPPLLTLSLSSSILFLLLT